MTRITILTKLRFIAALAPLLMLLVAPVLAFHVSVAWEVPAVTVTLAGADGGEGDEGGGEYVEPP